MIMLWMYMTEWLFDDFTNGSDVKQSVVYSISKWEIPSFIHSSITAAKTMLHKVISVSQAIIYNVS